VIQIYLFAVEFSVLKSVFVCGRIECDANEVSEEVLKEALQLAHTAIQDVINAQKLALSLSPTPTANTNTLPLSPISEQSTTDGITEKKTDLTWTFGKNTYFVVPESISALAMSTGFDEAVRVYSLGEGTRQERNKSEGKLRAELMKSLKESSSSFVDEHPVVRNMAVDAVLNAAFRHVTLMGHGNNIPGYSGASVVGSGGGGRRVDGRLSNQLRPISCSKDVLPIVHGSSFFIRGDTHVICTTTLGPKSDCKVCLIPISFEFFQ
jgi:hypothetical protein